MLDQMKDCRSAIDWELMNGFGLESCCAKQMVWRLLPDLALDLELLLEYHMQEGDRDSHQEHHTYFVLRLWQLQYHLHLASKQWHWKAYRDNQVNRWHPCTNDF